MKERSNSTIDSLVTDTLFTLVNSNQLKVISYINILIRCHEFKPLPPSRPDALQLRISINFVPSMCQSTELDSIYTHTRTQIDINFEMNDQLKN